LLWLTKEPSTAQKSLDWFNSSTVRFRRAPWKGGDIPVGESPTRQLLLQPEAIRAVMEVTKWLKPLV